MNKIKCLNSISKVGLNNLKANYEVTENMDEASAVLVRSAAMKDMELPEGILAIARAGAGVNNIPLDDCAGKGICVFNTPGANANAVRELVICGMLLASRDVIGGVNWVQSVKESPTVAKDVEKGKKAFAGCEIMGKTLGVIGLGAVGAGVANGALGLGMNVIGYDPFLSPAAAWRICPKVRQVTELSDIYRNCDYITIHVPLMDNNHGMIGKDAMAMMKDGVVVLNFARDLLVDDDAMAEALASGKVRHYVTDFPNPKSANTKGVIAIPHLGASTEEAEDNCAVNAVDELMDYIDNGNIRNSVVYPAVSLGACSAAGRISVIARNRDGVLDEIAAAANAVKTASGKRGNYAYALMDVGTAADQGTADKLKAIDGVIRVRVIQ